MLRLCLIAINIQFLLCYAFAKNNSLVKDSELITKIVCKSPEFIFCSESNSCVKTNCAVKRLHNFNKLNECPSNTNYCPNTDECLPVCPQTNVRRFEEIRNKLCTNVIKLNIVSYIIGTENKSSINNTKGKIINNESLNDNKSPVYAALNSVILERKVLNANRNRNYELQVKLIIKTDYIAFISNNLNETIAHILNQISSGFNLSQSNISDFSIASGSVIIRFKIPVWIQKIVEEYVSGVKNLTLTDIKGNRYLVENISAKYVDSNNNEIENKLITVKNAVNLQQYSNSKAIKSNENLSDVPNITANEEKVSEQTPTVSSDISVTNEPISSFPINTPNEVQLTTRLSQYITSISSDTESQISMITEREIKQTSQDITTVPNQLSSDIISNTSPLTYSNNEITTALQNELTTISIELSTNIKQITTQTENIAKSTEQHIISESSAQQTTLTSNDNTKQIPMSTSKEMDITSQTNQNLTTVSNTISTFVSENILSTENEAKLTTISTPNSIETLMTSSSDEQSKYATTLPQYVSSNIISTLMPIITTNEIQSTIIDEISLEKQTKPKSTKTQELTTISNDISPVETLNTANESKLTTALSHYETTLPTDSTSNIKLNSEVEPKITSESQVVTSTSNEMLFSLQTKNEFDSKITSSPQEITTANDEISNKPITTTLRDPVIEITVSNNNITSSLSLVTDKELKVTTNSPQELNTDDSDVPSNTQLNTKDIANTPLVVTTSEIIGTDSTEIRVTTSSQKEITSVPNDSTLENRINTEKESIDTSPLPQNTTSNSISSDIPIITTKLSSELPKEETVATTEQQMIKTTISSSSSLTDTVAEQITKQPQTKSILLTTLKPKIDENKSKERVSIALRIDSEFPSVVGDGIDFERLFVEHIKPQFANLLRVPIDSIINITVKPGSVIIRFDLIPVNNSQFSVNFESIKAAKQEFERKIQENYNQYIKDRSGNNHKLCLLNSNVNKQLNPNPMCCSSNASLFSSDGYLILIVSIIAIITTIMMVLITAYTVRWFVTNKYKRKTRPDYHSKFISTVKPLTNARLNTMEANALNTKRILEGLKTRDTDTGKSYDSGVWINSGAHDIMMNGNSKHIPEAHNYCPPNDTDMSGTPKIPPEVIDKLRTQWKINDDKLFQ